MVRVTDSGLYCEAGDFFIDPWSPVDRAVITHAHSDHACWGSKHYLTSAAGHDVLRMRVGPDPAIEGIPYGKSLTVQGASISLHPAGHILGSSQIRIEINGQVTVVSGDYKLEADATCAPFEPLRCHTFVTESTFGLPIYRWPPQLQVTAEINAWWRGNRESGRASLLFAYALGKAQRVLAGLDPSIGPIYTHGAVEKVNRCYRDSGVELPATIHAGGAPPGTDCSRGIIVAPPSSKGSPWMRKFGVVSTGLASGWMRIRGARRRRSLDRGFVLSDHADWPGLMDAVAATQAERVLVTHGYRAPMVDWLRHKGLDAHALETRFEGERDDGGNDAPGTEPEA